jgi:hypothetical protein
LMIGRLKEMLIHYFQSQAQNKVFDDKRISLFAEGFAAAIIGLLSNWLDRDMPFSVEYMAGMGNEICFSFISIAK